MHLYVDSVERKISKREYRLSVILTFERKQKKHLPDLEILTSALKENSMSKLSTRAYLPNIDIYNRFKSANNQIHLSTPLTFKNVCNAFKNGYPVKGAIANPVCISIGISALQLHFVTKSELA
jgi:hypothetical protein